MASPDAWCNCESAYCRHHGGQLVGPDGYPTCDPCSGQPTGRYRMAFVGDVCELCALTARENGFASSITEYTPEGAGPYPYEVTKDGLAW